MKKSKAQIFIGTSGWTYRNWQKNFYPEKLPSSEWLHFYANAFSTVEVNSTFYHTPRDTTVKNWYARVPDNFKFSIKINRNITHGKKLLDCAEELTIFYKSLISLENKVGPILIQLPPSFKMDQERLLNFISLLDKTYKYTFEFRHSTWFNDTIYKILSAHNMALCMTDLNGSQSPEVITGSFTYLRLHGPLKAYWGCYGPQKLNVLKKKMDQWIAAQTSIYCYFDNTAEEGFAIQDAKYLLDRLQE